MKANLKISDISRNVKLCVNALDTKDTLKANIRFEAEGNELRMMATNGSYSISVSCPCDVQEEGVAVVDGKMAYSVISKGTTDCVITSDERNMTIKAIGRTRLPNIGEELPSVKSSKGKTVTFDAVEFKNAISRTSYAIAEDQTRIVLTGAHVVTDGSRATITSLDGFRLAQTAIQCEGDTIDIIVPAKILSAICDAITDGKITLSTNGNGITVVGERFQINALLLTGEYIDTDRIIPKDFATKVLVKTASIKNLADSATVASGVSNIVKFAISEDNISVMANSNSADSSNGADFHGDVEAMVDGNGLNIAFNLKYLIQTLNHILTDECEFRFNSPVSPCIITPHEENVYPDLHLILPVRTFN